MNYKIIARFLSITLLAIAGIFLLCCGVSWHYETDWNSAEKWILCAFFAFLFGVVCLRYGWNATPKIFRREALALICFSWIITIFIGTLPYLFFLPHLGFANALFESTSGFTTTGATILDHLEDLPRSLLFFRALSQWIGGLGIIIFFVAFFSSLGSSSKILFSQESTQCAEGTTLERIQSSSMRILVLYLVLTGLCIWALYLCRLDFFDAICHGLTTVSTGGFGTRTHGLADFHSTALEWVTILFMVIGGTNFVLLLNVFAGKFYELVKNTEFKYYIGILLFFTTVIAIILFFEERMTGLHDCIRTACFNVTSILTTTGFATSDFNLWWPITHVLLLFVMFIGGCSGSTSGGVKVIRVAASFKIAKSNIEKNFRPRIVRPIYINRFAIPNSLQSQFVDYIFLIAVFVVFTMPIYALLEPHMTFEGSLSSYIACLFNVGPGFAEVGPMNNFAFLHDYSKWFLSLVMLLGRLEMYAVLALFIPSFWKNFI